MHFIGENVKRSDLGDNDWTKHVFKIFFIDIRACQNFPLCFLNTSFAPASIKMHNMYLEFKDTYGSTGFHL